MHQGKREEGTERGGRCVGSIPTCDVRMKATKPRNTHQCEDRRALRSECRERIDDNKGQGEGQAYHQPKTDQASCAITKK